MYLDKYTPCGRYGQARGEGFLRRRETFEPVETPRRYYNSDSQYLKAKAASAKAWSIWRSARYGPERVVVQTPFFELLDEELKLINTLIQSGNGEQFKKGVTKFQQRITRSTTASARLQGAMQTKNLSRTEVQDLLNEVRRGPQALVSILEKLKVPASQEDGKRKLAQLCYDRSASPTNQAPAPQLPTSQASHQNLDADLSAVESRPKEEVTIQTQAYESRSNQDKGKVEETTDGKSDIHTKPVVVPVQSNESTKPMSKVCQQELDPEHDSARLTSNIQIRDFAF